MVLSNPNRSSDSLHLESVEVLSEDSDNLGFMSSPTEASHSGDYSTQMEELFEGEDSGPGHEEELSDEEDFVYSGVDSGAPVTYTARLRDVLGQDHESDGGHETGQEVPQSPAMSNEMQTPDITLPYIDQAFSNHSPTASVSGLLTPESRPSSPGHQEFDFKLPRPFLHPTVSRLRSYTPQSSNVGSNSSTTSHSHLFEGKSPPLSAFSSLSRLSSSSNLRSISYGKEGELQNSQLETRQVFKWTELQAINRLMFSRASQKASTVLGAPLLGSPTTLAANGLICLGTSEGKIVVHDFNQTLICICESSLQGDVLGPVTAIALSHDHTFAASGHATGYILLYNLKQPHSPIRTIAPTTLAAVASGRKEGHLQGSRIVSVGFVAGRHTALLSADEHGLAFFHSLGKFLFVEAPDILRILGRYPNLPASSETIGARPSSDSHHKKPRFTVLAMAPLPLGTIPHPTDGYHPVALLTPTKLVVVGLRPTPRTWFKFPREFREGGTRGGTSKWTGTLAWFPSIIPSSSGSGPAADALNASDMSTDPILAFSWGNTLQLIRVFESKIKHAMKNPKSGKMTEIQTGIITHDGLCKWSADDDILALQWMNYNQILICTRETLQIYDIALSRAVERVPFDALTLISPLSLYLDRTSGTSINPLAHSIRTYKGKLFLLKRDQLVVGTLLTWADRILALVEKGDFLEAIDLTRTYYTDEAPGNRNNLPTDPAQRKAIIGGKLLSLMDASAQYAFSEDRMTDGTHATPDNRGVDRTELFEGLVAVCCRASITLDDFEYLFEDLFQKYDDSGITSIYLQQLEPFILDSQIRHVPPRITQKLITFHAESGHPEYVERLIWHMDPSCIDLNQAIHLCQQYHLYDALIFVYTRALRDYVSPIVEMLGLIRKVLHHKKSRKESSRTSPSLSQESSFVESVIVNAYKIFPYLANILSGLSYPSEEPLGEDEAFQAKKDVYSFLFFGRSSVWPPGEHGKLILTSDEVGGVEPTYPYARQLLLFDSESFLHTLDIAFEDAYLNDESQTINRLMIVRIILEIVSSSVVPQEDVTMANIFIARNVPKYPQFLSMTPSTLHDILVGLAEDPNPRSREDRQLAAEYLLSVYNPHDSDQIAVLLERAGFFRILRSWYYHDHRWAKLLATYVDDPEINSRELLTCFDNVLSAASRSNRDFTRSDLTSVIVESLTRLLNADVQGTARLLNKFAPKLHSRALAALGEDTSAKRTRYLYLSSLLTNDLSDGEFEFASSDDVRNFPVELVRMFLELQCQFDPQNIIHTLRRLPRETFDMGEVLDICESRHAYASVVWATNWQGKPQLALSKAEKFQRSVVDGIIDMLADEMKHLDVEDNLRALQDINQVCRDICMEYSRASSTMDVPLEDLWFQLLNSQILGIQIFSACEPSVKESSDSNARVANIYETVLARLRSLVQTTFGSLVSITSTSSISFPRLFKRLVNASPPVAGAHHTEFRMILTGMLESYRSDEDMLQMLKRLVDRDLFDVISLAYREQAYGWAAIQRTCQYCHEPLAVPSVQDSPRKAAVVGESIVVSRTGFVFHQRCRTPEVAQLRP